MKKNKRFISIFYFLPFLLINLNCFSWGLYDLFHNVSNTLQLKGNVTTYAGVNGVFGYLDGYITDKASVFNDPEGIASDGVNLFIADSGNNVIRKINLSTGQSSLVAGQQGIPGSTDGIGSQARFNYPMGLVTDGTNLYVTDYGNSTIRKIVISTGAVSTFAGSPGLYGNIDGTGTGALFSNPIGITFDGTNLYVADTYNCTIRQVNIATRAVITVAGSAGTCGYLDSVGTAANFGNVYGITNDGINLYVADNTNHCIRTIAIAGFTVSTLAGTAGMPGSTDAVGTSASFNYPEAVTTDGVSVFVSDTYNHTIRQIDIPTTTVTTLAGIATISGFQDGPGLLSYFYYPAGLTMVGQTLYVADSYNYVIRSVSSTLGNVSTFTGSPLTPGYKDGLGPAAVFNYPQGMYTDGSVIYMSDSSNNTISKVDMTSGKVTMIAGIPGTASYADGPGLSATFSYPMGLVKSGNFLYVVDNGNCLIRQIDLRTNNVSTFAGAYLSCMSFDGTGTSANFNYPSGITTDGVFLYVADTYNNTIRKISISTASVTTIAGLPGFAGTSDGVGSTALFNWPYGITTDGSSLYVTDSYNYTIRKIDLSSYSVSTLAGTPGVFGSADGTGPSAQFYTPSELTTDGTCLYVADTYNYTIRQIEISSGKVTTLAGQAGQWGTFDGTGSSARFDTPMGITMDSKSLYVADSFNSTIRRIE